MGNLILPHKDLAGVNFTGSTGTFHSPPTACKRRFSLGCVAHTEAVLGKAIWKDVAQHIDEYKSYPRLIGEHDRLQATFLEILVVFLHTDGAVLQARRAAKTSTSSTSRRT
mgnify:CR=1 FL=1